MPVVEQKTLAELHQIQIELSIIRKAFCAYVEAKGVKVPGYIEPKRQVAVAINRKKARTSKRAK